MYLFGFCIVRLPRRQLLNSMCRQTEKQIARIPGLPQVSVNVLVDAERRILHRVDSRKDNRQVGVFKELLCPDGGLTLQKFQGSDEIAAAGKRCPWTRWNDHRQINRRQGCQRRIVAGDPIAGCGCERDSLRRFRMSPEAARYRACASRSVTLSNRL